MSPIDWFVNAARDPVAAQGYARRARDIAMTRWLRRSFGAFGSGAMLYQPVWILGSARGIEVGAGAVVGPATRIAAFDCRLRIGEGADIVGGSSFIALGAGIDIGRDVLIAWNVHVYDAQHRNDDPELPIRRQGFAKHQPVTIGDGAHLGTNVYVGPGVTIGRNAVIGANAVVVDDVPDHAIAVGAPARTIGDVRAARVA